MISTDDDKWFIDKMNQSFQFKKQYIWTAIGGFLGALVVVFTSFDSLTKVADQSLFAVLINSVFIGMGGNWLGNQLIKSENLASIATTMKSSSTVSGIISDVRPQKEEVEVEPEKKVEVEPEKKVEVEPEKKVEVEPEKKVEVEPEKKVEVEPEKKVEVEPEKKVEVEPEKKVEVEPEKKVEVEPEKKERLNQEREKKEEVRTREESRG